MVTPQTRQDSDPGKAGREKGPRKGESMPVKMQAEKVDFYYGDFKALKNINMDFEASRITALIGPSGCGKSTFLRCLNRMNDLERTSRVEGTITLDGQDIYSREMDVVEIRRRVWHGLPEAQSVSQEHL